MSTNITWHETTVSKAQRQHANGHKSFILWFTGLSASGKSTLANAVSQQLFQTGKQVYVLDGDNIRHGLNKDLGFDEDSRKENIRRIGEVAKLFVESGQIVCTAFISPYVADRAIVRELVGDGEFIEVYVEASLEACEQRDPKGLYKKARAQKMPNFTGITAPYEAPTEAEIVLNTEHYTIEQNVQQLLSFLQKKQYI